MRKLKSSSKDEKKELSNQIGFIFALYKKKMNSTCMLPPISDLFNIPDRVSTHHHYHQQQNYSPLSSPTASPISSNKLSYYPPLKAKRKRASPTQLSVLNRVFNQTYFPSTELRIELGKQLGMSPRTVQIWFQNKRQSLRTKSRRSSLSSIEVTDEEEVEEELDDDLVDHHPSYHPYQRHSSFDYSNKCPSPPWSSSPLQKDDQRNHSIVLPPPSHYHSSSFPKNKINLPPLRLPHTSSTSYPPSPPSSTYPSPISIDSILH
ncbi:unnamed protein product [Cunninghamella blakesleeana]